MKIIIYYLVSFLVSFLLTYILSKFLLFKALISKVKVDRWSDKVVPISGGIAIFLSIIPILIIKSFEYNFSGKLLIGLIGGLAMFALGLFDDIYELKSFQKFILQIIIVLFVVALGVKVSMFIKPFNFIITVFWILGITNAFNLLDNMDGLSGGIAAISSAFLGVYFINSGSLLLVSICFILTSSILGFLIFNFSPAKIYLGDSGALFIGYFLSVITILGTKESGASLLIIILFPILILIVPIIDTVFVSITRRLRGQSVFEGGKDHLSHRLVLLGLSERQAVLFLYIISILFGGSIFVFKQRLSVFSIVMYFFIGVGIIMFSIYIGKLKIEKNTNEKKDLLILSSDFLYKKRIFHIIIDLILISLIFYISFIIRFESNPHRTQIKIFVQFVPVIVGFKLLFLYFFNMYKKESRYFGFRDGLNLVKALTLGSATSILLIVFLIRFSQVSRGVFIIDWMLSIIVIGSVKLFYRIFDELFFNAKTKKTKKIFILGDDKFYTSIDHYLKTRTKFDYIVKYYVNLHKTRYDSIIVFIKRHLSKGVIMLCETYNDIGDDLLDYLKDNEIEIKSEKEFFASILEEK
jgi:UDP-GlcNAc:undecaprenyl-phosphate GlcNAc-1-phosphate transferase